MRISPRQAELFLAIFEFEQKGPFVICRLVPDGPPTAVFLPLMGEEEPR